jgi:hypothetical protein
MKITQFIKQLNSTEVGEGNTNDSYAAVPSNCVADLANILPTDEALELADASDGIVYTPDNSNIRLHKTNQNGQFRIAGLGMFFRKHKTTPGDRFLFEIHDDGKKQKLLIGLYHRPKVIMLHRYRNVSRGVNGMTILNTERFNKRATDSVLNEELYVDGNLSTIEVRFLNRSKKKNTSLDETDFYDLLLNGASILDRYSHDEYVEIDLHEMTFRNVIRWQKITLNIL